MPWLLAACALTILLLALTRRRGHHPTCKRCGFDLSATWPTHTICPECGNPLTRRTIRRGKRRPRWLLAIPAALILLASITWATLTTLTGIDWYAHLPTWSLIQLARTTPTTSDRAINALHTRLNSLTDAQVDRTFHAIGAQTRRANPFSPDAMRFVADVMTSRSASPGAIQSVFQPLVTVTLDARPRIRQGAPLPIDAHVAGPTIAGFPFECVARLESLSLDETSIDDAAGTLVSTMLTTGPDGSAGATFDPPKYFGESFGDSRAAGRSLTNCRRTYQRSPRAEPVRANLEPGPHTVTATWRVQIRPLQPWHNYPPLDDVTPSCEWAATTSTSVQIVPADTPTVTLQTTGPPPDIRFARELPMLVQDDDGNVVHAPIHASQSSHAVEILGMLDRFDPGIPDGAYDVLLTDATRTCLIGWWDTTMPTPDFANRSLFQLHVPTFDTPRQLIFRPSIEQAERTTTLTTIWGNDVVIDLTADE